MPESTKEKKRKLSPAEQRRLEAYEKLSEEYIAEGYKKTELTSGILSANIFALLAGLPFAVIAVLLFLWVNPGSTVYPEDPLSLAMLIVLMLVLIVVHELIHGITWSIFAANHWKDIGFGFVKEYLTPYCTCACPLSKGKYIAGALMPLLILGILPMTAAVIAGCGFWLVLGIIMTISAGGDILLTINILRYKSNADKVVYIDHPTELGGVIFEK